MPASFPLNPWFPVKFTETNIKTLISSGEGGRERRRSKVSTARLRISFALNYFTDAQLTTLYAFYVARHGAYEAFNITIKSTTYLVRFSKDGLSWDWFKSSWHKGNIELQEVTA